MLDPKEKFMKEEKHLEREKKLKNVKTDLNVNWRALNARSQRTKCVHCTQNHPQSEQKRLL